jgi:hypothetical protein
LHANQIQNFESREEGLQMYVYRHIKEEINPRSYYFCKMLLCLFKQSLNNERVKQAAEKYLMKLKSRKELEHFEVIPYENLWEFILVKLEDLECSNANVKKV